jgi:hypothetical protein
MTRWTITHRGVPVAAVDAESPELLGSIAVSPLPAFDSLRTSLPGVWRDASPEDADVAARRAPIASEDLELRDERGTAVLTTRLELVVTGPRSAVAFISFDTAAAPVGARVGLRPRGATDATPEA